MDDIKVSIWCITYNHRDYIRDAIESFLSQRTDFNFEVIVHDDASVDGTSEIIRQYEKKYSGKVKAVIQKENLWSKSLREFEKTVFEILKKESKGKYIALCEGDDFWIDNNKLQIQIDYMDAHADCVMTAHDAVIYECISKKIKGILFAYDKEKDLSAEELIMWYNGNFPTASMVMKSEVAVRPGFFQGIIQSGDWAQQLYCITKGKIHYFDRIMSCYRMNVPNSYTQRQWSNIRNRGGIRVSQIHFLQMYDSYTNGLYKKYINMQQVQIISSLFGECEGMKISEFELLCDEILNQQRCGTMKILEGLKEIFHMYKDDSFYSNRVKTYLETHSNTVIMGTGVYGKRLANQIISNGGIFEGFVVSDNQTSDEKVMDKHVWKLSNLPFDREKVGIIIGCKFELYRELCESLEKADIKDYIFPFMICG